MSDNKLAFDPIPVSRAEPEMPPASNPGAYAPGSPGAALPRATDLLTTRFPSTPLPPLADAPAGLLPPKPSPLVPIPPPAVKPAQNPSSTPPPRGEELPTSPSLPGKGDGGSGPSSPPPAAEPPSGPPMPSKTAWVAEVLRLAVTPTKRKAVVVAGIASLVGGASAAKYFWPLPPPRATLDTTAAVTARAADPDLPPPLPEPSQTSDPTPTGATPSPILPNELPLPASTTAATSASPPDVLPIPTIIGNPDPSAKPINLSTPPAIDLPTPAITVPDIVVVPETKSPLPQPAIVQTSNQAELPDPTVPKIHPAAAATLGVALSIVTPTKPAKVEVEPVRVEPVVTSPALSTPAGVPALPTPNIPDPPAPSPAPAAAALTVDLPTPSVESKPANPPMTALTPPTVPPEVEFKAAGSGSPRNVPPPAPVVTSQPTPRPAAVAADPPVRPAANTEAVTDFDVDLHEVKPGESYAAISRKYLGDDRYAEAIRAFNGNAALTPLQKVQVPPIHVLRKRFPNQIGRPVSGTPEPGGTREGAAAGGYRTYAVPPGGMTLKGVARLAFGDEQEWRKVWDLNPKFAPQDEIPEGTRLILPADARIGR